MAAWLTYLKSRLLLPAAERVGGTADRAVDRVEHRAGRERLEVVERGHERPG